MDLKGDKSKNNIKDHIKSVFGYQFSDEELMLEAITHRSVGIKNYERFELLGDAIIQLVVTEILLNKFAKCNEGELSLSLIHI